MANNDLLNLKLQNFAAEIPNQPAFLSSLGSITWQDLLSEVTNYTEKLQTFANKRTLLFINNNFLQQIPLLISTSQVQGEFILISSYHTLARAQELMIEFDAENIICVENQSIQILAHRETTGKPSIPEPLLGILTSGTTGAPKCARYSWDRLSKAVALNEKFKKCRWMMSYHITNFAGLQVFLQCFLNGGCLILPKNWPSHWNEDLEMITSHHVEYLNCTATYSRKLILSMTESAPLSLKRITLGGEVVDQALINDLKNKFIDAKIIHIYASTEMGARIEVKDEQAGFPENLINEKDIRIVDSEIQLRPSERSMISYLKNTSEPSTKFDVWISTGDLVEVKEGRVFFLGRKDLMINVGGFKVNPTIVEAVIRQITGVEEVLISGIKNPISGNLVKALLVIREGFKVDEIKTLILKECKNKLPYYSVPRVFEITDQITLTSSSKIKRGA